MSRLLSAAAAVLLLAGPACLLSGEEPLAPPEPAKAKKPKIELKEVPKVVTDNKSALIRKHRDKLTFRASSFWPGWHMEKLVDGDLETSWFSAQDDTTTKGKTPWVEIIFPEDVTIRRVTVLGNREPAWLNGYTILAGKLELLDKEGLKLYSEENDGLGNFRDFDFQLEKPIEKVRSIKFISLGDQGDQNPYTDIAIAEIQAE